MASLQDQLLKAGIVDEKKAKKLKQEQRKAAKQNKGKPKVDEGKLAAQKAMAEKAERDRALARQRNLEAEKKAIQAQIVQLIQTNRVARNQGEVAYNFTDGKKIKKLYVDALQQKQLTNGVLAIVKLAEQYELVPARVAEKIQQRDPDAVLVLNAPQANQVDEDDPYADYQIPDDLMW
ncbi:DUF2058 domain-containing protein [Spongiibacter taiwanensis]|uniref:DUF2058 domain-containing protein n=1 Tax=Spongiibacter taiwanensis TaxID=1748242 RepID=UPI0020357E26|nr:DUF2058 domain-containing protein [Spongiibacter taiwanensis]USA44003.1 DUF2058 domain-containing protein [Spongiibacter taiwanensis]